LFLSGHPGEALAKSGIDLAAIQFLAKPFNGETFLKKINEILATKS
jgi:DNA-binding response OmpR family regulator